MSLPVIAFITGGYSGEAEISYKSAVTIENNLDQQKFKVYKIDIRPDGWIHTTSSGVIIPVNRDDFSLTIEGEKISFDAVLIGIHGTPGEDGKLQGYFDMLNLPYTSCDAATSALTFNKRYTVAVAAFAGINVAKSLHLFKHSPLASAEILKQLQLPVFVKPNNGGSSIGMSKVNDSSESTLFVILRMSEQWSEAFVESPESVGMGGRATVSSAPLISCDRYETVAA